MLYLLILLKFLFWNNCVLWFTWCSAFMGLDKCTMACIQDESIIQSSVTALRILCALPSQPSLPFPPPPWKPQSFHCLHSVAFSRMSYSWNCSRKTLSWHLLKNGEADYSGDGYMGVWQQGRRLGSTLNTRRKSGYL